MYIILKNPFGAISGENLFFFSYSYTIANYSYIITILELQGSKSPQYPIVLNLARLRNIRVLLTLKSEELDY